MAYMRSLSTRGTLFARRYKPSFAYVFHNNDCKDEVQSPQKLPSLVHERSFGTGFYGSTGYSSLLQDRRCSNLSLLPSSGLSFYRYMSTNDGCVADKTEIITDVVEVMKDSSIEALASQTPVVNEVAIAAADSSLPVAILQHFIDTVHSFTGFNWWASIVVATILIRGATVPLLINQLKSTAKLTLVRPRLEEIRAEVEASGMDPTAVAEGQKKMKRLFKEYGVSPLTPLKGLVIQGPVFISFFFAISNMVEKVPSFKVGGAYWFTDLTTPDAFYVFPILTGLTFLITVECNMQEGMEGNPVASTMKKFSRVVAVATVPFTMNFPKAIFCYWITSNLFSLVYGLVLKVPGVKKALGVPEIPETGSNVAPQPPRNLFPALKLKQPTRQESTSSPVQSKDSDKRISSSSVLSQRIRSLEKQVKGRNKNKKR